MQSAPLKSVWFALVVLAGPGSAVLPAGMIRWDVTSGESAGGPYPASSSIHIDAGDPPPPPPPGFDTLPGRFVRTHTVDVTLQNVMTTMPVSRARLTAADNGPVISGEQVDFEVFAEVPNGVQLTPVTLNLKFNYRAADQTDIFGILLPALQPLVQFDESSFQIDYGLDVAGILFPVFDGVPTHSLAGTAVPTNWRIRDVRAVIGSLDLFIDLEPQSLSPSSGGEFSLLSMTLTGNTIETADVPEPSSITLFVVGLVTWIGYPLRRRVNCD